MTKGLVAMKQKYLGYAHPGQDLCWCEISIGVNAVVVTRFRGGRQVSQKFFDESRAEYIKSKLRSFYKRRKAVERWSLIPGRSGYARLFIYYPSARWYSESQPPLLRATSGAL